MENLRKYFQYIGFKDDDLDAIADAFVLQQFDKNDLMVMEGKTSKYIGIVETDMFQCSGSR